MRPAFPAKTSSPHRLSLAHAGGVAGTSDQRVQGMWPCSHLAPVAVAEAEGGRAGREGVKMKFRSVSSFMRAGVMREEAS